LRQVELPDPAAARPIERAHVIKLDDREAERVHAYGGAEAADPVAIAAENALA